MFLSKQNNPFRFSVIKAIPNANGYCLKELPPPSATSPTIAASASWVSTVYSSRSTLCVLPVNYASYKRTSSPPTVSSISGEVNDVQFSSLNDDLLGVADSNGSVKFFTASATPSAISTLNFDCPNRLAFHPTTEGIFAVGHKGGVSVADYSTSSSLFTFTSESASPPKDVLSLCWNRQGNTLATLTKSNDVHTFDPRTEAANVIQTKSSFGVTVKKPQTVMFAGDSLLLFGLSAGQRPIMQQFDLRSPSKALTEKDFDFSNGFVMPQYDFDASLLFLTVRGSNVLSVFDVANSFQPVTTVVNENPFKGFCLINKRAVNTAEAEIDRIVGLTHESLDILTVTVPRKTTGFHDELYPDTADAKAAQTIDEWKKGGNHIPMMVSMTDIHLSKGGKMSAVQDKSAMNAPGASRGYKEAVVVTEDGDVKTVLEAKVSQKPLEQKEYVKTAVRSTIEEKLKTSIFRHVSCVEPPSIHDTHYDLKLPPSLTLCENIRGNSKFFAVPWTVLGGSGVAVFPIGKVGRTPVNQPLFKGHKSPSLTFDLCQRPKFENLLASGSVDGDVRIYSVPDGGLVKDQNDEIALIQTSGKVNFVRFHPFIDNVIVTSSSAFDEHTLQFWDVRDTSNPKIELNGLHKDCLWDIAFHPRGHLVATTCKDGKTRVINVMNGKVLKEFSTPEGTRDTHAAWLANDFLLTGGFGTGSARSISLWDTNGACAKPSAHIDMERQNNVPIMRVDYDTNIIIVGNYGGTYMQLIEVKFSPSPRFELLNTFQTQSDLMGYVFLPKRVVDVDKVELLRALKLTKDSCEQLTHTVPRKRKEFFQDDLYPQTIDVDKNVMSTEDFFGRRNVNGCDSSMVTMNLHGRPLLSNAPPEEMTEAQIRYQQRLAEKDKPKAIGATGHTNAEDVKQHFNEIAKNLTGANRWDYKPDTSKVDVDEDEWN